MNNQNNNKIVITLLIVIIVLLAGLCILFATKAISLNTNKVNNKEQTNESRETNTNDYTNSIQTKLVDNLNCSNSETTFNGITVKVEQKTEDMVCNTSTLTINGVDVKEDNGHNINSYEFFDKNVIIMSSTTSGTILTIYNINSKSTILKFDTLKSLEGYFIKSYKTNNNVITLNAESCGPQCGEESIEKATFEIEYSNETFSEPKLINKTTS